MPWTAALTSKVFRNGKAIGIVRYGNVDIFFDEEVDFSNRPLTDIVRDRILELDKTTQAFDAVSIGVVTPSDIVVPNNHLQRDYTIALNAVDEQKKLIELGVATPDTLTSLLAILKDAAIALGKSV